MQFDPGMEYRPDWGFKPGGIPGHGPERMIRKPIAGQPAAPPPFPPQSGAGGPVGAGVPAGQPPHKDDKS